MERPPDPEKSNPLTSQSLAAEDAGDQDQNLTVRLNRYGTAKARNHQMASHLVEVGSQGVPHTGYTKLADKLYRCGSFLRFRHYLAHSQTRLVESRSCDVSLLCPLCAIRRGAKLLRKYLERCEHLAPAHDFYAVTLTVKNGPDLSERYRHLLGAWKRIVNRSKKGYGVYANASGAFGSIEFTRSDAGWHPHMHMIWAVPKGSEPIRYGKESQLAMDWLAATGDSFIVHAQKIQPQAGDDKTALLGALCETLKYAVKFGDLSLDDNLHAYLALKGKRLSRSYGCFWGLEVPNETLDDDELDGPYVEMLYRFMGSRGYTLQVSHEHLTLAPETT